MYCLYSQFIYELTRQDGTSPVSAVVQKWVEKISQHLGILIRHTERLSKVLVTRARNIRRKVQGCTAS